MFQSSYSAGLGIQCGEQGVEIFNVGVIDDDTSLPALVLDAHAQAERVLEPGLRVVHVRVPAQPRL